MPTWLLILILALLLLALYNGIKGTAIEWPVMPLRKRALSVVFIVGWAAITFRVAAALLDAYLLP